MSTISYAQNTFTLQDTVYGSCEIIVTKIEGGVNIQDSEYLDEDFQIENCNGNFIVNPGSDVAYRLKLQFFFLGQLASIIELINVGVHLLIYMTRNILVRK